MYILLLSLIYLVFISLGLPDSLLGAGWPVMQEEFGVPISYVGMISMTISGCTILSSLMSDRMTKRFGTRAVTIFSVFLTAFALLGFSFTESFYLLILWAVPYGLGAGAIDAALNNYVALYYNSRHMSWLHCFWGVGTIISPYIMSYSLRTSVWNTGYRWVGIIQIGIVIILLLTSPVWNLFNKNCGEEEHAAVGIGKALKIKGVGYLLLGFMAYCGAESIAMLWASSYLVGVRGVEREVAAAFASLFFIGITAGRFVSGFVSDRFGDRGMIRIGTVIALAGTAMVALPVDTDTAALAGFVIIGFGCAPVYPSIIHSTPTSFGKENSQSIIGIQMSSAYVGSTFMPPLFGLAANAAGLYLLPVFLFALFFIMIYMTEKTYKLVGCGK